MIHPSFHDLMASSALQAIALRQYKGTLVATSYNPKTHAVKGILMPEGIETGWIPITSAHTGNGFGILVGPNVGSKDDLKGDQFDVEFENGDPNTPVAKLKHFSAVDNPPQVQSGEILIAHEKGTSVKIDKDGAMTMQHVSGGSLVWDKDGNATLTSTKIVLAGEVHLGGAGGKLVHRKDDLDSAGDTAVGSATKVYAV